MIKTESALSGKSVPVIENGYLIENNLKKLRLPVDKLEARLRQSGIRAIKDVQTATIESSGQLGYTLKEHKQPATKEDIQNLIDLIQKGKFIQTNEAPSQNNIFTETISKETSNVPRHLQ